MRQRPLARATDAEEDEDLDDSRHVENVDGKHDVCLIIAARWLDFSAGACCQTVRVVRQKLATTLIIKFDVFAAITVEANSMYRDLVAV